ncbi:unnamed protein product [Arabis nemorensis]|uniref:Uncharacterized protein n=1 Tax=Arabis nemorensis TaxID=586526 RepID=A0A565CVU7_9BRAS|nr:unnamed protein product [Arabis nemorensis]
MMRTYRFHKGFTFCFGLGGLHHRQLLHPSNLLKGFSLVLGFDRVCRLGWLDFCRSSSDGYLRAGVVSLVRVFSFPVLLVESHRVLLVFAADDRFSSSVSTAKSGDSFDGENRSGKVMKLRCYSIGFYSFSLQIGYFNQVMA